MRPVSIVGVAALIGTAFCLYLASPFLPAILGAVVLAVVFSPVAERIRRSTGQQSLAAAVMVALAFVLVLIPAIIVGTAATRELRDFYGQLNARSAATGGWVALIESFTTPALDWAAAHTGISAEELRAAVVDRLAQTGGAILRSTTAVAAGLTEAILQIVVALMTLFFLFRDGPAILSHLRAHSPLPAAQTDELLASTATSVVANIYGVLAVSAAQGLLAGVGFWLVGLPSPVLWGLVTALFSMVPLVGSGVVWVPAVILLAAGGEWTRASILLAWSAGLVAMADNFVRPWIIGQRTNSNPLLVFFALLGGAKLFGLAGLFIGPVALSVTAVLLKFWSSGTPERTPIQ